MEMRRSARISARKGGLATSKTQNESADEIKSKDLSAVPVAVVRDRPRRKTVTTPKVIETARRSNRKNPVKYRKDEDDSNSLENTVGAILSGIECKTNDSKKVETLKEISNDVVDNIDNLRENNKAFEETEGESKAQSYRHEDQTILQPTRKPRTKRGIKIGKNNVNREEQNTDKPPEKQQEPSLNQPNDFEMETKDSHVDSGFVIISKEEIDMGNIAEDDLIIENDLKESKKEEETNELFENKPSMKDKEQDNEFSPSNTSIGCSRTDDSAGISHQVMSTCSQSNIHDVSKENKYKKIQNIGRLEFSQSSLQSKSSKRNLLKLTSEVFQKIPFKITKETLMVNKVSKGNDMKFSKTDNKNAPDEHILQQDIISVTVNETKVANKKKFTLSSELDPRIKSSDLYLKIDEHGTAPTVGNFGTSRKEEKKVLEKSVIGSDFEQKECSFTHESRRQKMKKRKQKSEETAGQGWFNLPKTEMTNEIKRDLQVIKMRNVLDPKRFYKRGDKKISKYFQVGTVVSGAADFYSSRIPKKDRKRGMVEQLLADAEFRQRNKRRYLEIQEQRANNGRRYKSMKNRKKGKKGKA